MRPWFSTASGNVVYALNQVLLQSRGDEIRIAAGVPAEWKDYSFKLACHGNLLVEVVVKDGRLVGLRLLPGDNNEECLRTLVIPSCLVDEKSLNKEVVKSVKKQGDNRRIEICFKGRTELIEDRK